MLTRLVKPFTELAASPFGLWCVIGAFAAEEMAYAGMLTLMTTYFSKDLHWPDAYTSIIVGIFTMLVTVFMLLVGSFAESFGLRRAISAGLALSMTGRAVYCLIPSLLGQGALVVAAVVLSLVLVAAGFGIIQPSCYSGVKQYTDARTSSMGYAMIYAIMNLALFVIGALSAWIRPGVQAILDHSAPSGTADRFLGWMASFSVSGVQAVNWLCFGITAASLLAFMLLMTRKVEAARLRPDEMPAASRGPKRRLGSRFRSYLFDGPFGNVRFVFFIFMLLPVRTLFAHQWLTMPEYILRSYPKAVGDKMEWLVNWINPLIIFFGVPLTTVLTRRFHVYTMMIVGSLVSAAPTFLLCFGPDLNLLITYFVLFSIGEALWAARFLEYASELAPPGRVAQYMGLAQVPWLLAKGTTGLYAGFLLARYCPPNTPPAQMHTGVLWLIYGSIAMISPIGLWLARNWVRRGLHNPGQNLNSTEAVAEQV